MENSNRRSFVALLLRMTARELPKFVRFCAVGLTILIILTIWAIEESVSYVFSTTPWAVP
jgi:hypothetical protein